MRLGRKLERTRVGPVLHGEMSLLEFVVALVDVLDDVVAHQFTVDARRE